jgi:hypothetical protein
MKTIIFLALIFAVVLPISAVSDYIKATNNKQCMHFYNNDSGNLAIICGMPGQPYDYVQLRSKKTTNNEMPDLAAYFDDDGSIAIQISNGSNVKIRTVDRRLYGSTQ